MNTTNEEKDFIYKLDCRAVENSSHIILAQIQNQTIKDYSCVASIYAKAYRHKLLEHAT